MANNYLQFSFTVDVPPDQKHLFDAAVEHVRDEEDGWLAFEYDYHEDSAEAHLYTHESGTPEEAARVAKKWLQLASSDEIIMVTYAHSCSAPRPDMFAGGAYAAHRGGIEHMGEWEITTILRERIKTQRLGQNADDDMLPVDAQSS